MMNEDSETWYEVQTRRSAMSRPYWETRSDHDTRDQAYAELSRIEATERTSVHRVKRVTGIGA